MNRTDTILTIAVLIVALALGATIFFIFQAREGHISGSSRDVIEEIDQRLQQGYMQQAASAIQRLARRDVSAATYLMLLKRADILRRQTDSWELFLTVAQKGQEQYSGRVDLYAMYIYALLRSGRQEEAVRLTGSRSIEGDRWQSLREELSLYMGKAARKDGEDLSATAKSREELFALLESDSPEPFFRLYRQTSSTGFLLDAVLLYARESRIPRAWQLLEGEPSLLRSYPELAFFLAIDAHRPQAAQVILQEHPNLFDESERTLLMADLAYRLENTQAAEELCFQVIQEYPQKSWIPYHNAAYMQLKKGNAPGNRLLRPDSDFSDDSREFVLNMAQLLIAYNQTDIAQRLLKEEGQYSPESAEYQLLMEKAGNTVNPERYKALLRMLVNRDGGEKYAKHLAWFSLGIEDYHALEQLLGYYSSQYGIPAWLLYYQGVLAYQQGHYEQSMEFFIRSREQRQLWESSYAAALAAAQAGSINKALSLLEEAQVQCGQTENCDALYFAQADIHIQYGEYQKARKALSRGLAIDPDDIDGHLLDDILAERSSQ